MKSRLRIALLALLTVGCAHTTTPTHVAHSPSLREHGAHARDSEMSLQSGAAVALLEALIVAVRDEDAIEITRCFAAEPIQLGHTNALTTTRMRQDLAVQRVLGARHASGLAQATSLDAMIDRTSIQTTYASERFPTLPSGVHDDDIVLTFRVRPLAERALLAIALRGEGLLVLRLTTTGAHIVAL